LLLPLNCVELLIFIILQAKAELYKVVFLQDLAGKQAFGIGKVLGINVQQAYMKQNMKACPYPQEWVNLLYLI